MANGTPNSLARIALRWMVRECFSTDSGIMFMSAGLGDIGLDPTTVYPKVQQRPPPRSAAKATIQPPLKDPTKPYPVDLVKPYKPEEDHELLDALSPIYDQLESWFWKFLEQLPLMHEVQTSDDKLEEHRCRHNGKGRIILRQTESKVQIHRSVAMRMEAHHEDGTSYKPKASFETALSHGKVEWID